MIMWIAALVLMALTIGIGYRAGAIRAGFSFLGLLCAAALAVPFGPMFAWIFPLFGYPSPIVAKFFAPIFAFFAVSFVFKGIAAFVHRKVEYHYRYNTDEAHHAVWEMMQRRVGACLGALNGLVYFFVFALIIAVFGYATIQMGTSENSSWVLNYLAKSAEDLQATRMDKVVGAFNPASDKYFEAADLLGLLHHNRKLIDRLENYPVFAALAQKPIYQAMGKDKELQDMLKGQASFGEIWANANVQEAVTNTDIVTKVLDLDLADIREFLETGVSPKFEKEKILGRWSYDSTATILLSKAMQPDVPWSVWTKLKPELAERFANSVFTAYADKVATFRLGTNLDGKVTPYTTNAPVRLANGQVRIPPPIPRWLTTNATYSATGEWNGSTPDYTVKLGNRNGTNTVELKVQSGYLSFPFEGKALLFTRQSD